MAAVLGTNVASLWASKNLQSAQSNMANSVERLSSGLRINRARDDAAGLGIANGLTQQIHSADQGIRNLNDGISVVQTAEGALAQVTEMAQRILTLSIQGTNGALTTDQKTSITSEMTKLLNGIDAVQARSKFGSSTTSLLSGSSISVYSSKETTDSIVITATALGAVSTGTSAANGGAAEVGQVVAQRGDLARGQGVDLGRAELVDLGAGERVELAAVQTAHGAAGQTCDGAGADGGDVAGIEAGQLRAGDTCRLR